MKTILVPTDFSAQADNAARYAIHLAKKLSARIKLCNAITIPVESAYAMDVVWPLEDYTSLKTETTQLLESLAKKLMKEEKGVTSPQSYHPEVEYCSEIGGVIDVVRNVVDEQRMPLVVMGMSGVSAINKFFLGSNSSDMIDKSNCPVLLIPSKAVFNPIKKIAFATDLSKGDIELVQSLASLAQPFNAEILLVHISDVEYEGKKKIEDFLTEVTSKVNYSKIYYRHVKSMDVEHGLDWISENGQIDMLAMVHRKAGILKNLFEGSYTQKQAKHIAIPLLALPENMHPVCF